MALYQLQRSLDGTIKGVLRRADNAQIPRDADNRDWQDFLAWRDAGNTPDAADPVDNPTTPRLTVARLARALIAAQLITKAQILAALDSEP
jgi:hypothetical protein